MLVEADAVRRRAREDKAAIALHAGHGRQAELLAAQTLLVGFVESWSDQLALVRVGPAVIGAAEHRLVAAFPVAHEIGAMAAAVEEHAKLAVLAAHEDDGLQANLPAYVVAVLR